MSPYLFLTHTIVLAKKITTENSTNVVLKRPLMKCENLPVSYTDYRWVTIIQKYWLDSFFPLPFVLHCQTSNLDRLFCSTLF